jgi:alpha-beta hydrolase superfamily lysophospholipase
LCLAGGEALKRTPLLFLVPERDPVVSSTKTLEFAKGIDDRALRVEILRARRHEALNDLGAVEVYELIHSWVRQVVDSNDHKTISD